MNLKEFKEEKLVALKKFCEEYPIPILEEEFEGLSDFFSSSFDSQVALIKANLPLRKDEDFIEYYNDKFGLGFNAARKEIINYLEK